MVRRRPTRKTTSHKRPARHTKRPTNKRHNSKGDKKGQRTRWKEKKKAHNQARKVWDNVEQERKNHPPKTSQHPELKSEYMTAREEETTTIFEEGLRMRLAKKGILTEKRRFYYDKETGGQGYITPDITIPSRKLVIEVDGQHHLSDPQLSIDKKRDATIRKAGFEVWHVQNEELMKQGGLKAYVEKILAHKQQEQNWSKKEEEVIKSIQKEAERLFSQQQKHEKQARDQWEEIFKEYYSSPTHTPPSHAPPRRINKCKDCGLSIEDKYDYCIVCHDEREEQKTDSPTIKKEPSKQPTKSPLKTNSLIRRRGKIFSWVGWVIVFLAVALLVHGERGLGWKLLGIGLLLGFRLTWLVYYGVLIFGGLFVIIWTFMGIISESLGLTLWIIALLGYGGAVGLLWLLREGLDHKVPL